MVLDFICDVIIGRYFDTSPALMRPKQNRDQVRIFLTEKPMCAIVLNSM